MSDKWKRKGYIDRKELKLPSEDMLQGNKIAIIECPQEIPCDPCREVCPVGAIEMENINSVPVVDEEKCTGCGICVRSCPGLAIYLLSYDQGKAVITLPFEFEPLPQIGAKVQVTDRKGKSVCEGRVIRSDSVDNPFEETPVLEVEFPVKYAERARWIRRKK